MQTEASFKLCDSCATQKGCLNSGRCTVEMIENWATRKTLPVPEMFEEMAQTFRDRNKVYGDNWRMVGRLMAVMFPEGVTLRTHADYDVWHLFELQIVKLSRFAISKLTHQDSIHDMTVYGAMISAILKEREKQ